MRQPHRTAKSSTDATAPIVTVDRITDAHRNLNPPITFPEGWIVAIYRGETLDVIPTLITRDPDLIGWLHTGAQLAAKQHGYAHHLGCPWCHVNNCTERAQHETFHRSAESTWRECAA